MISTKDHGSSSEKLSSSMNKSTEVEVDEKSVNQDTTVHETGVKRALSSRVVSMVAIGGTIGSGLFIGTSEPLRIAGPVNALISYIFFGVLAYFVTQELGEMATHTPIAGSFCTFNTKYLSRSLGFATNWCYWFSWAVTFSIELFAVAQVIEYWTDAVPNWG